MTVIVIIILTINRTMARVVGTVTHMTITTTAVALKMIY